MNTLILLAITIGATLPDVTIDNTKLLYDEADWLSRARVRHYVDMQTKMDAFAATTTAVNAEVEASCVSVWVNAPVVRSFRKDTVEV